MPRAFGNEKTKKLYLEGWLTLPPEDRVPLTKENFAKLHKVARKTLTYWEEKHQRAIDEYDSEQWLKNRTSEMDEALVAACINGSPQALRLFFQLQGRLIEKSEVNAKVELSASDYARIHNKNREYLREKGYLGDAGMGQVQSVTALLPEEIREDTGQE